MELNKQDRQRLVEILAEAFDDNQSVNYIIRQDDKRSARIQGLMDYACRVCEAYGKVVLTADRQSCALVLLPHTKKFSLKSLVLDLRLILEVTGLGNLMRVLRRESLIHKQHPNEPIYYLWFIAVDPAKVGQGLGTELLKQLIADAQVMHLPFYLETSTAKNIPWYRKYGFNIFHELDLDYRLFFMRR